LLAAADCTIFIGSEDRTGVTLEWSLPPLDSPVIHIDVDAAEIGRNYVNSVGILADAKLGTAALAEAVAEPRSRTEWDRERSPTSPGSGGRVRSSTKAPKQGS